MLRGGILTSATKYDFIKKSKFVINVRIFISLFIYLFFVFFFVLSHIQLLLFSINLNCFTIVVVFSNMISCY